ncbi:MAG: tRNA preQ1(34) S-adenosylmethionine ribosyltransferase-isomerase QueA [Clostridia bacterium]|nr:tRNA preQ1(34) S-adenosylmethionine ribosyltransferase-isomerase QueA [Clostridia bacterium]
MDVKDFDYYLPEELIAQVPLKDRASSRLLVLDKVTGEVRHGSFRDIKEYLRPGDVLVMNDTKVIPARLLGVKKDTGAAIEFVLLRRLKEHEMGIYCGYPDDIFWEVILKPGRKARQGAEFVFGDGLLHATVIHVLDNGNRIVKFSCDGIFEEILDRVGLMPLPPYIHEKLEDRDRYQTVYARENGSAAAPTAGLHFTEELIDELREAGVRVAFVTLHVGLGTFRPVKVDRVEDHYMHSEYFEITGEACDVINGCRSKGGRVISVGTTSTRVLESAADENGFLKPRKAATDIFIYPGYRFKIVDGLITNFHLPKSTLIMLVSALAGRGNVLRAYNEAVKERYRFFSFGDAMFIK